MAQKIRTPLYKGEELLEVLQVHFQLWHLARIKFMVLFILAVIKIGIQSLEQLAGAFDSKAQNQSSLRRIKRFLNEFGVDYTLFSKCLIALMQLDKTAQVLALDRTEWQVGKTWVNVLMLSVCYQGIGIPIWWKVCAKKGLSKQGQRIECMQSFKACLPTFPIKALVADREFIGQQWLAYLQQENIPFYMRLKENLYASQAKKEKKLKAWFQDLQIHQGRIKRKVMFLQGQALFISAIKLEKEYLLIASNVYNREVFDIYKQRWQIETLFKALKTQGFQLENTFITDQEKIAKLLALISIAFAWCYLTGLWLHEQKPIRLCKNGKREYSFFRYGFLYLQHLLLNSTKTYQLSIAYKLLSPD